jgi:DHA1 family bicyclomycin/chloramphenicol resistance-like MFS transporter
MMSMAMACTALGIDLMLPAFGDIRSAFGLPADSTAVAGIVTAYFVGLALGQVLWGPIADRYGRKTTLFAGLTMYMAGAAASALSPSLAVLYGARFAWGVGAAGPRVGALAVVRDTFEGDRMARAMSFIMAVFVLVPVVAPSLGAGILAFASWRWVFAFCVVYAAGLMLWLRRLPETLHEEHRSPLEFTRVLWAAGFVVRNRQTLGYTLALTALFGVFSSYLASSEIIVSEVFDRGPAFPLVFGGLAAVMGAAMLLNGAVVSRFGVRRIVHAVMLAFVAWAAVLTVYAWTTGGRPPFWPFMAGLALMLTFYALLFPNMNTIALDPMGSVAGMAAAVTGVVTFAVGAVLGSLLDRAMGESVTPLAMGFLGYGALAVLLILWAERGHLFRPLR